MFTFLDDLNIIARGIKMFALAIHADPNVAVAVDDDGQWNTKSSNEHGHDEEVCSRSKRCTDEINEVRRYNVVKQEMSVVLVLSCALSIH